MSEPVYQDVSAEISAERVRLELKGYPKPIEADVVRAQ